MAALGLHAGIKNALYGAGNNGSALSPGQEEEEDAEAGPQAAAFAAAWNAALDRALEDAELLAQLRRLLDKGAPCSGARMSLTGFAA